MAAMKAAATRDRATAARVHHFLYRTVQELYDFQHDPDALHNLVGDSRYAAELDRLRTELERWMAATGDPALEAFGNRGSPEALRQFMDDQQSRAGRKRVRGRKR